MLVKTQCTKCGVTIKLDFGSLNKEEALDVVEKMDHTPRECPGGHVELSSIATMWSLHDAVHRGYDLGEVEEPEQVISDKEFAQSLLVQGKEIIDGGANKVPELDLPSLHNFKDLEHMGFGNFKNQSHLFIRCDSPRGTRFYERQLCSA